MFKNGQFSLTALFYIYPYLGRFRQVLAHFKMIMTKILCFL